MTRVEQLLYLIAGQLVSVKIHNEWEEQLRYARNSRSRILILVSNTPIARGYGLQPSSSCHYYETTTSRYPLTPVMTRE